MACFIFSLTEHTVATKLGGIISSVLGHNASIFQGSELDPISCVYDASDLQEDILNSAIKVMGHAR